MPPRQGTQPNTDYGYGYVNVAAAYAKLKADFPYLGEAVRDHHEDGLRVRGREPGVERRLRPQRPVPYRPRRQHRLHPGRRDAGLLRPRRGYPHRRHHTSEQLQLV